MAKALGAWIKLYLRLVELVMYTIMASYIRQGRELVSESMGEKPVI